VIPDIPGSEVRPAVQAWTFCQNSSLPDFLQSRWL
jgi:hypothetical protein